MAHAPSPDVFVTVTVVVGALKLEDVVHGPVLLMATSAELVEDRVKEKLSAVSLVAAIRSDNAGKEIMLAVPMTTSFLMNILAPIAFPPVKS